MGKDGDDIMNKKTKEKRLSCIAYLSVKDQPREWIERLEKRQLNYIKDYARAHNIEIVGIVHRSELGAYEANRQFELMAKRIENGEADGVIVANVMAVSKNVTDVYYKIGRVNAAGGKMISVDDGELRLRFRARCGYERD